MKRAIAMIATTMLALLVSVTAVAQEETPTEPAEEQECRIGQICETEIGESDGERGEVFDPPGAYLRSIVTMSAIALIVGTYLFVALTGKRIRIPFLSRSMSSSRDST